MPRERAVQNVFDERGLSGAAHAGDRDEDTERHFEPTLQYRDRLTQRLLADVPGVPAVSGEKVT